MESCHLTSSRRELHDEPKGKGNHRLREGQIMREQSVENCRQKGEKAVRVNCCRLTALIWSIKLQPFNGGHHGTGKACKVMLFKAPPMETQQKRLRQFKRRTICRLRAGRTNGEQGETECKLCPTTSRLIRKANQTVNQIESTTGVKGSKGYIQERKKGHAY